MNEVTRIHLGRQPFMIAVDAHEALRAYLSAIKDIDDNSTEVNKEVELRMAELLEGRGINSEKVVLLSDVEFLKQQLGEPKDFKEDDGEIPQQLGDENMTAKRRLFRDTEHGMLAGVASGLANYIGVDVILIRLIFVITVIAGGWGILLYIVLWLVIPEAKSSSDRLQMYGKAVTVGSLKEVVERADVQGAARRAGGVLGPWINSVFWVARKVLGIAIVFFAVCILFILVASGIYLALHHTMLYPGVAFPVGTAELLLVINAFVWAGLATIFLIIIGMAMVQRRWPIAGWATGVIIGLLVIGLASGTALTANAAPAIRQRFDAAHQSVTRNLMPFTNLDVKGDAQVDVEQGNSYTVNISYFGHPNLGQIKTTVANNTLVIDSTHFTDRTTCTPFCLFRDYNLQITVYTPVPPTIVSPEAPKISFDVGPYFLREKPIEAQPAPL